MWVGLCTHICVGLCTHTHTHICVGLCTHTHITHLRGSYAHTLTFGWVSHTGECGWVCAHTRTRALIDSHAVMFLCELREQVAGVPMEVNQPLGHVASIQSGIMSGGLLVANATNGQAPGPPAITTTSQPPTTLQQVPPTALQQVPPATLQQGPPTAPPATMGGQRVGQFAGKMPTPQDNAVIGIMSSESGNSSSSNSGSSSSDSSDSSDENDNEVVSTTSMHSERLPHQELIERLHFVTVCIRMCAFN